MKSDFPFPTSLGFFTSFFGHHLQLWQPPFFLLSVVSCPWQTKMNVLDRWKWFIFVSLLTKRDGDNSLVSLDLDEQRWWTKSRRQTKNASFPISPMEEQLKVVRFWPIWHNETEDKERESQWAHGWEDEVGWLNSHRWRRKKKN